MWWNGHIACVIQLKKGFVLKSLVGVDIEQTRTVKSMGKEVTRAVFIKQITQDVDDFICQILRLDIVDKFRSLSAIKILMHISK